MEFHIGDRVIVDTTAGLVAGEIVGFEWEGDYGTIVRIVLDEDGHALRLSPEMMRRMVRHEVSGQESGIA